MTWLVMSAKSGKREVAISLLMLWAFITGYVFFWITPAEVTDYKETYSTITTAIFMFAGGAFGLDFYMKSRASMDAAMPSRRRADNAENHQGAV